MELVTVYWRPGCPYCARLRQDLLLLGGPTREVDIWAHESAAATVRELADGNETVPTVVIGGRGYVNPSAATVLAEVRRISPGFVGASSWMEGQARGALTPPRGAGSSSR